MARRLQDEPRRRPGHGRGRAGHRPPGRLPRRPAAGHRGLRKGLDGARVPLPWSGDKAPFGFTTGKPWLPLQDSWREFTVESEDRDPESSLNLYRKALKLRKELFVGSGELVWTHKDGMLGYKRGDIEVLINISGKAQPISGKVLLASHPVTTELPHAAAVWLSL